MARTEALYVRIPTPLAATIRQLADTHGLTISQTVTVLVNVALAGSLPVADLVDALMPAAAMPAPPGAEPFGAEPTPQGGAAQ